MLIIRVLRWLAVPMAGIAFWLMARFLGLIGLRLLRSMCPPELVISNLCTASWYVPAESLYVLTNIAILSAGLVLAPAFIAPSHRFRIALVGYVFSLIFTATVYVISGEQKGVGAIISGGSGSIALWLAAKIWWTTQRNRSSRNKVIIV